MNKLVVLLILFAAVIITAGCISSKANVTNHQNVQENYTNSQETQKEGNVVKVTQLDQINTSLEKGPVLLKIGAEWCEECQSLNPILTQVAADYSGKATVMTIDIDKSPKLANYFGIYVIPDCCVIVGNENGKYVYMQQDGNISTERSTAKILKIEGKDVYENVLNLALHKEKNKSN
jgi:thioredoxin 1